MPEQPNDLPSKHLKVSNPSFNGLKIRLQFDVLRAARLAKCFPKSDYFMDLRKASLPDEFLVVESPSIACRPCMNGLAGI
jgi:hypothetical protein